MVVTGNEHIGSTNSKDDKRNNGSSEQRLSSSLDDDTSNHNLDQQSGLLSITSSHHSEIHLDNSRFKEDPVLQSFRLAKSERVLGLERTEYRYKSNRSSSYTDSSESSLDLEEDRDASDPTTDDLPPTSFQSHYATKKQGQIKLDSNNQFSSGASHLTNLRSTTEDNSNQSHSSLPPDLNKSIKNSERRRKRLDRNLPRSNYSNTQADETNEPIPSSNLESYKISNSREDFISEVKSRVYTTKIRGKTMFQDCLVVTNRSVYVLRLDRDPITLFIEAAMQGDVKTSEKLAATFDLDAKCLLELAADIKLSEGDFAGAIALYRLSGCKHLKAVLKFAASGHVQELLRYLTVLEKTPNLDVSNSDRIHLSNLTLMAYFQQGNFNIILLNKTKVIKKKSFID